MIDRSFIVRAWMVFFTVGPWIAVGCSSPNQTGENESSPDAAAPDREHDPDPGDPGSSNARDAESDDASSEAGTNDGADAAPDGPASECTIEGTQYASGADNPANPCQSCQPSKSASTWSNVNDETTCTNGACCDGECTNTQADPLHCGGCGVICSAPNAEPVCTGGNCKMGPCDPGYGDCNASSADGCEADLHTDVSNCGGCSVICSAPNAEPVCTGGNCKMGPCDPGYGDCNASSADGCEVSLDTDASNCGACSVQCPNDTACLGGACL